MRKKFVKNEIVKHRLTEEKMLVVEPLTDEVGCCSVHSRKVFNGKYRLRLPDYSLVILFQDELLYGE